MRFPGKLALALITWAERYADPAEREWIGAMRAELDAVDGGVAQLRWAAGALPLDVFVVASHDPLVVMREYARITGLAEMPALWTFGYLQSHRTLTGPEEVLSVARTFREKKLPCDALIYLGTAEKVTGSGVSRVVMR